MKWFYNMKIGKKLLSAFLLVAIIAGVIGYSGISNLREIDESYSEMQLIYTEPLAEMGKAGSQFQRVRLNLRELVLEQDNTNMHSLVSRINEFDKAIKEEMASFEKTIRGNDVRQEFDRLKELMDKFEPDKQRIIDLALANQKSEALALIHQTNTVQREIDDSINKLFDFKIQDSKEKSDANTAQANSAVTTMIAVLCVGIALAVGLGIFMSRIISRPVNQMAEVADKLALGDVNVDIEVNTKDEIGMLAQSFKTMADNVRANALAVEKIASGDVNVDIKVQSENDLMGKNLSQMIKTVKELMRETNVLVQAAQAGKLNTRGNAAAYTGAWSELLGGVNRLLDEVLKPINEAAACLQEMSKGNMDVGVTGEYQGDFAIIKDNLNATLAAINEILNQVAVAVDQVAAGSQQVSDSSQALSQGATESAASVEEISASLQQLTVQTKQNAENATQANQLATQARANAEKGNDQVNQMVKAMSDINESAANISKIIKAIDEIAFQTNLLALNAAVEAARAGKHGKGFTVVAEEVRNLAQRSAKAAKETAEMIEGSIKKSEVGTQIAEDTSKALEEIVSGATKVTDLIGEIASASKEQAQAIGQINEGLTQVDQIIQENTASSEQSASASEELSSQALQLKQMLGRFKLKRQYFENSAFSQVAATREQIRGHANNGKNGARVRPEEIISLDDTNFDRF